MSAAYSAIVRSLENFPEPAIFKIAFAYPSIRVVVQVAQLPVGLEIGREVRQVHIMVSTRQQRVPQRFEDARFILAEVAGEDQVQRRAGLRFVVIMPARAVPAPAAGHLVRRQAEQEEILFARFFCHFDGRAVACPQRQGSVHHELHVARAAGLVAGRRNLVGDIGGRNQPLGKRHAVFRQEHDLESSADDRISVDGAGQIIDELDDDLGQVVGRRRLAGKEKCPRGHLEIRILPQPVVQHDDAQRVEQLPLVFVDAFDLAIEDACPDRPSARMSS